MSAKQHGACRPTHLGTSRALATLPAMTASLLLLVFLLGGADRWEGPVLLSWLAAGVLTLSTPGERVAVRVLCRFRRLSAIEQTHIEPTLIAVLEACGLDDVDLYVCNGRGVNAYAAGRRSIAITRQVLDRHRDGALSDDVLAGLLSHEVGHLITRSVRWSLIIAWFAMPWRLAYRAGGRIAPLAARQPRGLLALVVLTAFIIAIDNAVRRGEWSSAAVLAALALCPVISPIADAAISRASEHQADRYAAQIGYNKALTLALRTPQVAEPSQLRHPLLRHHPGMDRRLRRLEAAFGQGAFVDDGIPARAPVEKNHPSSMRQPRRGTVI
jgi:Zn-dependent protease with chaperone function